MDAITLLRDDHKTVEQLFKRFEKAGDDANQEKRQIVDMIIEELSVHAAIEEQLFYPVARATVPDAEDITLESLEEHHIVKWLLSELKDMEPTHERFQAKVTVLMENVRHHVREEQDEFFPKVRNALSRAALADLGQALADAKMSVPREPHPEAPDTPPGNSVMGTISGVIDRVGDNISGIAQGGVNAAQDLVQRIMNMNNNSTKRSNASANGRSKNGQAKSTRAKTGPAKSSRGTSARAASTRSASTRPKSTRSGSTSATKSAGSAAKKSARSAASTAKRAATSTGRTAKRAASKATSGRGSR
ncbi:MAG TPA: hemerythrin domain-containing protein [Ilumatobacteraceae bacterium]|jgi:hemerythrin-like domain-containing protein